MQKNYCVVHLKFRNPREMWSLTEDWELLRNKGWKNTTNKPFLHFLNLSFSEVLIRDPKMFESPKAPRPAHYGQQIYKFNLAQLATLFFSQGN